MNKGLNITKTNIGRKYHLVFELQLGAISAASTECVKWGKLSVPCFGPEAREHSYFERSFITSLGERKPS